MSRCYQGFEPAAQLELPDVFHPLRLHRAGEIIQYPVDRTFIENPVVPEAPQVQLQALELDAEIGRHVRDADYSEIRGPAFQQRELLCITLYSPEGTERRELVAVHVDFVIAIRVWISERFEQVRTGQCLFQYALRSAVSVLC